MITAPVKYSGLGIPHGQAISIDDLAPKIGVIMQSEFWIEVGRSGGQVASGTAANERQYIGRPCDIRRPAQSHNVCLRIGPESGRDRAVEYLGVETRRKLELWLIPDLPIMHLSLIVPHHG